MTEQGPHQTLARRRFVASRGIVIFLVCCVVGVYLASLLSYGVSARENVVASPGAVSDGINFQFDVVAIDTNRTEVTLRTEVFPAGSYLNEGEGTFAKSVVITARTQTSAEVTRTIKAGTPVGGATELNILVDGNPSTYPFDQYVFGEDPEGGGIDFASEDPILPLHAKPIPLLEVSGPGGSNVPVGVESPTGLQGWSEDWIFVYQQDVLLMQMTAKRGGGGIAFVLVVLALMIIAAIMAGVVAANVAQKRRPIEATMASWFAALLFALVPLRINLPGAPPIGAWLDVTVFYWVVMALLISMSVFVGSWLVYRKPPDD